MMVSQRIQDDLRELSPSEIKYFPQKDKLSFQAVGMNVFYEGKKQPTKELLERSINMDMICLKVIDMIDKGTIFFEIKWTLCEVRYDIEDKWIKVRIDGKANQLMQHNNNEIKLDVEGENAVFSFKTRELNIQKINEAVEKKFNESEKITTRGGAEARVPTFHEDMLKIPQLRLDKV